MNMETLEQVHLKHLNVYALDDVSSKSFLGVTYNVLYVFRFSSRNVNRQSNTGTLLHLRNYRRFFHRIYLWDIIRHHTTTHLRLQMTICSDNERTTSAMKIGARRKNNKLYIIAMPLRSPVAQQITASAGGRTFVAKLLAVTFAHVMV